MNTTLKPPPTNGVVRLSCVVHGAVQGVGFRPHVYRLATELDLKGWILNSAQGVFIEVEGPRSKLEEFSNRLVSEKPCKAIIESVESRFLASAGFSDFVIRKSNGNGDKSALILPDVAICPDCLRELFDPKDPRYLYPFINCTNCGPRFSIIRELPYDRINTTMRSFVLCDRCDREYNDPLDRRFHAQPIACPECGPSLEFQSSHRDHRCHGEKALNAALRSIRKGRVLALKGLGGFQLLVDARNEKAVSHLRRRKGRGSKPFALMCPDLNAVLAFCEANEQERALLRSAEAPIVLLRKRNKDFESSAPGMLDYGVMLPYTPLHHLIMRELKFPVVATSGNRSEEPICIDNEEALKRLKGIADDFLMHDRPIQRHVDDSIARVVLSDTQILRKARGYAPLPVTVSKQIKDCLAVGAHLKNAVALACKRRIFTSQHIGDLETVESYHAFEAATRDLPRLYDCDPELVVRDKHPDYLSSHFARTSSKPTVKVQHHLAHVFSCMADNNIDAPVLGVSWDGTGYGDDGTMWGGEFFRVLNNSFNRFATIRQFGLLGGDAAAKLPQRSAYAVLFETYHGVLSSLQELPTMQSLDQADQLNLARMAKMASTPMTSSMGRLFDAVASLLGICQTSNFEGHAAMLLEAEAAKCHSDTLPLPFDMSRESEENGSVLWILDWTPMIREIVSEIKSGVSRPIVAARFHRTLASMIGAIARKSGIGSIALTGGCFQNRLLTELAVAEIKSLELRPYWHKSVPPNDGGISVGQAYATGWSNLNETTMEERCA